MDLKEKKLLALSIFMVLLSSWLIGNLMDLGIHEEGSIIFLPSGGGNIALVSTILLIFIPILYLSYIYYRSKKENDFIFSKILLLGFWIFAFFAGVVLVIFGFWPLTILFDFLPNFTLPFEIETPLRSLYLDIGFILLLSLIGTFFFIFIYLKVRERIIDPTNKGKYDISDVDSDVYINEKIEQQTIEDSLSSTLDKAITEIDEGSDVQSTVINSYHEMTRLLEEKGAENDDYMTPREFKDEIINKIPSAENFVSNITFLFEEARYSPHELEEKDREEVIHQLKDLKEELG